MKGPVLDEGGNKIHMEPCLADPEEAQDMWVVQSAPRNPFLFKALRRLVNKMSN